MAEDNETHIHHISVAARAGIIGAMKDIPRCRVDEVGKAVSLREMFFLVLDKFIH